MSGRWETEKLGNGLVQNYSTSITTSIFEKNCLAVLSVVALRQRLESMEQVGKVGKLERLTYKERLNITALGREGSGAPN